MHVTAKLIIFLFSVVKLNSVYLHISAIAIMRIRKIAKSNYYLRHACISVRPSVCLHGTTWLPLDGF
jgi:hypothetical protein